MIMPFELVRSLNLAPHSLLFLLKVIESDEIYLLIVRQEDLKQRVNNSTIQPDEQVELKDHNQKEENLN